MLRNVLAVCPSLVYEVDASDARNTYEAQLFRAFFGYNIILKANMLSIILDFMCNMLYINAYEFK